nr:putative ribonuclease H-like domain-containing protein [Tanacetum cinerariifolium]
MQKRRNDVKARTTLLLALPDEHQLRFSKYETAKELWEATLKTFGGNEATKKTKKNQLKQQYGNFKAKEWLMYTIVWRNIDDLDKMSLDNVYNHLKVYEPEVQKKSKSNSQNMAFISSSNTSSGKGEVHTASVSTASIQVFTASTDVAVASLSHDTEENHALVADDEVPTEFTLMAKSSSSLENKVYDDSYCSKSCRKNTENLNTKISKLNEKLSDCEIDLYHYKRDLDNLIGSLRSDKNKEGLGYNAVPHPHAQVYSPLKKDLSWTSLLEFVDDTVTDYSRPTPSIDTSKCNSSDLQSSNFSVSEHENHQEEERLLEFYHQDRKSTTGGYQFLGRRLISWRCKKQTIVATSTTKAEYVAAASGCGQVLWIQN